MLRGVLDMCYGTLLYILFLLDEATTLGITVLPSSARSVEYHGG
jgi:hypothetical protein